MGGLSRPVVGASVLAEQRTASIVSIAFQIRRARRVLGARRELGDGAQRSPPNACGSAIRTGGFDWRWWRALAFAWLILATVASAMSSFRGVVPLDARTGQAIAGLDAAFHYPALGVTFEPFLALAHVIVEAPDFKVAGFSVGIWLFVVSGIAVFWMAGLRTIKPTLGRRALQSAYRATESVLVLVLYIFFACMVPLPGLSLVVKDPAAIVADLHSHTALSTDGFVSLRQNLTYHRERGYNVVGITDHYSDVWYAGAFHRSEAPTPEIIRGVEIRFWNSAPRRGYLLALGLRQDVPFPFRNFDLLTDDAIRQFIDFVKNEHRGAVVALSLDLIEEDIERLAADGVDGFEIANFGHPELSDGVRAALLRVQATHRLALVADSDWHGWSGFSRTWTVIKSANAAGSQADQVIEALRNRDPARIVPIVSQAMFAPSDLRGIFAPFFEIVRYGAELSPARLASWWIWTLVMVWLAARLRAANVSPFRCLLGGTLLVLGGALAIRGTALAIAWGSGMPHILPLVLAATSCGVGMFALMLAALIGREVIADGVSRRRPATAEVAPPVG
jgi:hypothetical protein